MPISEFLMGKPATTEPIYTYTPEQRAAMGELRQMGMRGLRRGFDFGPIEQQARTAFRQRTIPSIAERFTAMGRGAQASAAFPQQLGAAGAGLEESLAAMRGQYGLQQQSMLQNLLGMGLGQQFHPLYRPETPGFLQTLGGYGLQSAGQLLPLLLGLL